MARKGIEIKFVCVFFCCYSLSSVSSSSACPYIFPAVVFHILTAACVHIAIIYYVAKANVVGPSPHVTHNDSRHYTCDRQKSHKMKEWTRREMPPDLLPGWLGGWLAGGYFWNYRARNDEMNFVVMPFPALCVPSPSCNASFDFLDVRYVATWLHDTRYHSTNQQYTVFGEEMTAHSAHASTYTHKRSTHLVSFRLYWQRRRQRRPQRMEVHYLY